MSLLSVFLLCSFVGNSVAAQETTACPSPPQDAKEKRQTAGIWFEKAGALVDAGQYRAAVAAFECSMRMVEHPDTVFNAAQAARLGGDNDTALRFAMRYLTLAPDGDVADQAEKLIAELTPVASTDAAAEPNGQETPVENRPVASPPEEVIVGTNAIGTENPTVRDDSPPTVRDDPPPTVRDDPPPVEPRRLGGLVIAGYASLGVGGVGLVVGAVLQGLTSKAWSDGKSTDNYEDFKVYKNKMDSLQTGALVGLIAGGVVAGAGAVLLLVDRSRKTEKISVWVSPSGAGVSGRF